MPPLTFLLCARVFNLLSLLHIERSESQRGKHVCCSALFSFAQLLVFCQSCFTLSLSPPFSCFLCACVLVLLPFWSSDETCLFLLPPPSWFSASVWLLLFYLFLATFCQSSSISLHFCPSLSIHHCFFFFPPRLKDLLVPRSSHCLCLSFSLVLSQICVFLLAVSVLSFGLPSLFFFSAPRLKDHSCRLFVVFTQRVFPLVLRHMLLVWRLGSNELTRRASLMCSGGIC